MSEVSPNTEAPDVDDKPTLEDISNMSEVSPNDEAPDVGDTPAPGASSSYGDIGVSATPPAPPPTSHNVAAPPAPPAREVLPQAQCTQLPSPWLPQHHLGWRSGLWEQQASPMPGSRWVAVNQQPSPLTSPPRWLPAPMPGPMPGRTWVPKAQPQPANQAPVTLPPPPVIQPPPPVIQPPQVIQPPPQVVLPPPQVVQPPPQVIRPHDPLTSLSSTIADSAPLAPAVVPHASAAEVQALMLTTQSAARAALERLEAAAQTAPGQSFYRVVPNMGTPVKPVGAGTVTVQMSALAVAELPVASASGDVGATAPEAPAGAAAEGAPAPPAPAGAAAEGAPAPAAAEGAPAPAAPAATADSDTAIGDLGKHGDSMELDPHFSVQMESELGVGATKHSDPGAACMH